MNKIIKYITITFFVLSSLYASSIAKSMFMPGWGEKLSRSDIIKHIQKIRDFCACEAPDWANK